MRKTANIYTSPPNCYPQEDPCVNPRENECRPRIRLRTLSPPKKCAPTRCRSPSPEQRCCCSRCQKPSCPPPQSCCPNYMCRPCPPKPRCRSPPKR
ncbi:hypothetical protein JTB14_002965 [Gonioctena quinquepunctata]|nr:hypothetical protein JTB14_002965 [Gonioctena quinquepunctata]